MWQKHVNAYKRTNKILDSGGYRNIMDMNAGLAGFAAALESPKLWVMNVVLTIAGKDTLGPIYKDLRGFLYDEWVRNIIRARDSPVPEHVHVAMGRFDEAHFTLRAYASSEEH
ncbi:ATP binding protein [Dorcoceras hygrometricum]|nr:ATP binding protein [Dorcoceras hygrometricum]